MTATHTTLDAEAGKDLLRRCWMWHDARWFAAVAGEFGMEAANRINRNNVRELGRVEMRRLMKALTVESVESIAGALALYEAGRALYVPSSLMEADVGAVTEDSYEVTFRRCFVHENIVRAGIADSYRCAVFDRLQGWHDAWGLPLAEELPVRRCALAAGEICRQQFAVRRERSAR
ncbi:MAG: hypothetical protein HY874_02485 [Chloroflexi bacterium]|nr:hypothetical protein [Chloroflexota bacterium]